MTPRTMARLGLMAATLEQQLRDEIKRHGAALEQAAQQRKLLSMYRERLSQSWRDGSVVDAAMARRAGHFTVATEAAELQIEAQEHQARLQFELAVQRLAQAQQHRNNLSEAQRKAEREAERTADQRLEAARPWTGPGEG